MEMSALAMPSSFPTPVRINLAEPASSLQAVGADGSSPSFESILLSEAARAINKSTTALTETPGSEWGGFGNNLFGEIYGEMLFSRCVTKIASSGLKGKP